MILFTMLFTLPVVSDVSLSSSRDLGGAEAREILPTICDILDTTACLTLVSSYQ
jgi:hypothetical protein